MELGSKIVAIIVIIYAVGCLINYLETKDKEV